MKHIFKYILIGATVLTTGCNDFLELKPLNEIVAESFWTEKADVESVVYSCYSGMQNQNLMQRLWVWGDMRSDDVTVSTQTDMSFRQIIGENILETNPWLNWESFYQVINRCNTVITFAPVVEERDPNYTDAEMRSHIAEATWLRSLCYFIMARTFRDVPYTDKPSLSDGNIDEDYRLPAMPFKTLLKQLATDLEAVKGDALRLYPIETMTGNAANTSRVTTCAFYALLADIYLWLDEYDKVLDCTQAVIDYKMWRYDEMKEEDPESIRELKLMKEKYPLILEMPSGTTTGNAYNKIFGTGNSFESIFELYFNDETSPENALVSTFIGSITRSVGQCSAYTGLTSSLWNDQNPLFKSTDTRAAEYFEEATTIVPIRKHFYQRFAITPSRGSGQKPGINPSSRSGNYATWIFYRLTDVMLMRAEALVELGSTEQQEEAFELVSAIYNRANNLNDGDEKCLKADKYNTQSMMRDLVRDERHRELMFECKRWYDLVRYALRDGSNEQLISAVVMKQKEKPNAVRAQLNSQDALFWPYAERELDLNPNLKQNPAYITNETSQK